MFGLQVESQATEESEKTRGDNEWSEIGSGDTLRR